MKFKIFLVLSLTFIKIECDDAVPRKTLVVDPFLVYVEGGLHSKSKYFGTLITLEWVLVDSGVMRRLIVKEVYDEGWFLTIKRDGELYQRREIQLVLAPPNTDLTAIHSFYFGMIKADKPFEASINVAPAKKLGFKQCDEDPSIFGVVKLKIQDEQECEKIMDHKMKRYPTHNYIFAIWKEHTEGRVKSVCFLPPSRPLDVNVDSSVVLYPDNIFYLFPPVVCENQVIGILNELDSEYNETELNYTIGFIPILDEHVLEFIEEGKKDPEKFKINLGNSESITQSKREPETHPDTTGSEKDKDRERAKFWHNHKHRRNAAVSLKGTSFNQLFTSILILLVHLVLQ